MDGNNKEKIERFVSEEAGKLGLVVLHSVFRGTDSRPVIEITLDGERQINLSDCEAVSKSTLQFIDNTLNKAANYRLDVLSPGVDEPLIYDYQLKRSLEKTILIKCKNEDKETEKTGKLLSFTNEALEIVEFPSSLRKGSPKEGKQVTIPRSEVTFIKQVALIR